MFTNTFEYLFLKCGKKRLFKCIKRAHYGLNVKFAVCFKIKKKTSVWQFIHLLLGSYSDCKTTG